MDKIDSLIKTLTELKEELSKNVNMSYSGQPNVAKEDIVRPDSGYGKVTVKDTSPKPNNSQKPFGNVVIKEELTCSENGQWKLLEKDSKDPALAPKDIKVKELQTKIDAGTYKPDAGKIAGKMLSHPEKPLNKAKGEVQKLYRVGPDKKHMTMVKPWHEVDHDNTGMGHRHLMEVHNPGKPDHGTKLSIHHKQVEGFNQPHPPVEPQKLK